MSTIVDVRTPQEFEEGHVPGSLNIPLQELPGRVDEIRRLPVPIVLCCRSGARSGMALDMLRSAGITEASNAGAWTNLL